MKQPERDALVCFAKSLFDHRPLPAGVDWEVARACAWKHGLVPLADHFLNRSDDPVLADLKPLIRRDCLGIAARQMALVHGIQQVLQTLRDSGIPVIVLKGPALAQTIYPDPMLRPFGDLDLLCREDDWAAIHRALIGADFVPNQDRPVPPLRAWHRKACGHNQYFSPRTGLLVEVHFDLWQNDFRPRLGDLFWRRAIAVSVADTQANVLSIEDQIIHLCVHLHYHSYERLIWFTDLGLLLRQEHHQIDWRYIVNVARIEGVTLSVYFSLHYLEQLLGIPAPLWVQAALKPGLLRRRLHNLFWPAECVLNLHEMERLAFNLGGDVPTADEFLLNMLLTGRIRDKAIYLFKLLFPSGSWLALYHGTSDQRVLRRRRLIHAPKLFAMGVRGLCGAMSHGVLQRIACATISGNSSTSEAQQQLVRSINSESFSSSHRTSPTATV